MTTSLNTVVAAHMLTLVAAVAIRHEIDKLTASQRLDLNLEKGRMRCAAIALLGEGRSAHPTGSTEFSELHVAMQG